MWGRHGRRAAAALGGLLAVGALTTVPGTFALPTPVPVGQITVRSFVRADTPMWMLGLRYGFTTPPDCNLTPELHYKVGGSPARKTTICTPGQTPPSTVEVFVKLLDEQTALAPSLAQRDASGNVTGYTVSLAQTRAQVWAQADVLANPTLFVGGVAPLNLANSRVGSPSCVQSSGVNCTVELPTQPVFVGAGDGYTSQLVQDVDRDTSATSYDPNARGRSWIGRAVNQININQFPPPNADWALVPEIVADATANSAAIAPGGVQHAKMLNALSAHTLPRTDFNGQPDPLPSWNWLGISAGLIDVGLPNVLTTYANNLANNPAWDIVNGVQCPPLTPVLNTADARIADGTIKTNLRNAVAAAAQVSPGVHAIQVLYPRITESTNMCANNNAASVSNNTVITHLNQAIDITGAATPQNVKALNLYNLFGTFPTGAIPGHAGTLMFLTRPYGYPYPSAAGIDMTRDAAVVAVGAAAADVVPPTVIGTPLRPATVQLNGIEWWNAPVDIRWTATDGSGVSQDPDQGGPWPRDTTADQDGLVTYQPGANSQVCDLVGNCKSPAAVRSLAIDSTKPVAVVAPDRAPNANGWYNNDVVLTWTGTDPQAAGVNQISGMDPTKGFGPVTVTAETPGTSVTNTPGTICDLATNCADPVTSPVIRLDKTAPNVTPTAPAANVWGWYKAPVTITWAAADALSGLAPAQAATWSTTSSGEGTVVMGSGPALDKADNAGSASATVKIDTTAPTVTVSKTGGTIDGSGNYLTLPTVSCSASDALSGIAAPCELWTPVKQQISADVFEWTYTAAVTDKAGNASQGTLTFRVKGRSNFDTIAPVITITGVAPGAVYTKSEPKPTVDCTGVDEVGGSGFDDCTVVITRSPLPAGGPPGSLYTVTATGTDVAGNIGEADDVTYTVYDVDPANGRMTGKASLDKKAMGATHAGNEVLFTATSPGPGATVAAGSTVTATYNDESKIGTIGSFAPSVTLVDADGNAVPITLQPFTPALQTVLSAKLPANLADGAYTISFKAWDTDQNKPGGDFDVASWTINVGSGSTVDAADFGSSEAEFDLRCNGSPNKFKVKWTGGSFEMTDVDKAFCWDDPRWDEAKPSAPIDAAWYTGSGKLTTTQFKKKATEDATVEFTLTDQGEPGKGVDTFRVVVRNSDGDDVYVGSGTITKGEVQAHEATGNGTNNNGHLNGPNGHYGEWRDLDNDGYDRNGYDSDGVNRKGRDAHGVKRKPERKG